MDLEKIGKIIKEIRQKNNLTQKDLAEKYGVTYQAVSKWENGKNLPDITLISEICHDYNIEFDGLFKKKKNIFKIIIPLIILIVVVLAFILYNQNNFEFNILKATSDDFTLSGSISYNNKKTSIYITNINYCGTSNETYKSINCALYETNEDIEKKISSYSSNEEMTIQEFLNNLTLAVNDYQSICKNYTSESLYLLIEATTMSDVVLTYKIPLNLEDNCNST